MGEAPSAAGPPALVHCPHPPVRWTREKKKKEKKGKKRKKRKKKIYREGGARVEPKGAACPPAGQAKATMLAAPRDGRRQR